MGKSRENFDAQVVPDFLSQMVCRARALYETKMEVSSLLLLLASGGHSCLRRRRSTRAMIHTSPRYIHMIRKWEVVFTNYREGCPFLRMRDVGGHLAPSLDILSRRFFLLFRRTDLKLNLWIHVNLRGQKMMFIRGEFKVL